MWPGVGGNTGWILGFLEWLMRSEQALPFSRGASWWSDRVGSGKWCEGRGNVQVCCFGC
jgi:hypothetical protein